MKDHGPDIPVSAELKARAASYLGRTIQLSDARGIEVRYRTIIAIDLSERTMTLKLNEPFFNGVVRLETYGEDSCEVVLFDKDGDEKKWRYVIEPYRK